MILVIYYPEDNPDIKGLVACFLLPADASEYARKESSNNPGMIYEVVGKTLFSVIHETWLNGNCLPDN